MDKPLCLCCHKQLLFTCDTVLEDTELPPRRCLAEIHTGQHEYATCQGTTFSKDSSFGDNWRCDVCHNMRGSRKKIVSRKRRWPKPGYRGNGFFCTLKCGYQFALQVARSGIQIPNTKPMDKAK